ncbi:hypothetical protein BT96DRAFT_985479 [Gymnopus androsaceus JB14]|uniref:Xylanolytic transcriptional activator regulatory domain-containing protein n=1 Tax=Gymnopus androsaceus JB14 TaxID=1447944 RepID=A0A6A4IF34_9AGAR|nr:hypothetical protein BT96DRAFT_985479 [Gymnopus androsaceus JB14]
MQWAHPNHGSFNTRAATNVREERFDVPLRRETHVLIAYLKVSSAVIRYKERYTYTPFDILKAILKASPAIEKRTACWLKRSINIQTLTASILYSVPYIIPGDETELRQILKELASYIRELEKQLAETSHSNFGDNLFFLPHEISLQNGDENADKQTDEPSEQLKQLQHSSNRYYGLTSNIKLVKSAIDASRDTAFYQETVPIFKRPLFWDVQPWQILPESRPEPLIFPPQDLLVNLIDLWFEKNNPFLCVFHRGTFEKSVASGLHHHDRHFGETVLAMCALASRHSDDPRNFNMYGTRFAAGFIWIRQVNPVPTSFLEAPSLYQLQKLLLYAVFMQTTSVPYSSWILIGLGIRLLQDVGAHRKKSSPPSVSSELWKRVFWILRFLDLSQSIDMGRPRATTSDDYDVEFPLEVDDEYWELPGELAFKQPPGKPCRYSYSLHVFKLVPIMESIHCTMVSVPRATSRRKLEPDVSYRKQRATNEIQKALNEWLDAIPEQLKRDPQNSDVLVFNQSAILYMLYYFYRIFIHQWSGLTAPDSLEICVGTAHSCVHLMETHGKRALASPQTLLTIANAAIILLINIWRSKRLNLNRLEQRVQAAGRLWDTILNVVYISDLTDTYNLVTANSHQATQSGSTINQADVAAPSTFPVSFEQPQYWDASVQEYGSPAENEFNFPISSTSNMAPMVFPAESEVPPFNLSSVGSQYGRATLQASHTGMENTQKQPTDWSPHHATAATSGSMDTLVSIVSLFLKQLVPDF